MITPLLNSLIATATNIPSSGDQQTLNQLALDITIGVQFDPSGELITLPSPIATNSPSSGDQQTLTRLNESPIACQFIPSVEVIIPLSPSPTATNLFSSGDQQTLVQVLLAIELPRVQFLPS